MSNPVALRGRERWDRALGAALEAAAADVAATLPERAPDAVEAALAGALTAASAAGQWDVVRSLAAELEARRRARAGVVELDAERARRARGDRQ